MDYIVAVQTTAYPISPTRFAVESAFADHLRELRRSIGLEFARIVLVAPLLSEAAYQRQRQHLGIVNAERDGVVLLPGHPEDISSPGFWFHHAPRLIRALSRTMEGGAVIHSGMSTDIWRPLMALVNLVAYCKKQPVVFFVDIDFRLHSHRLHRLGIWSNQSYLVNRLLHDPLKALQVWLAPRMFDLVLFKSASMVRDFGGGREHVLNFFDTAHAAPQIVSASGMATRIARLSADRPLRLVYFGRLVLNKGIDRMISAVALARRAGADVRLSVIGDGPCRADLENQVKALGLDGVCFTSQVRYGADLFALLDEADISLAAPLMEDTPRSAFDSFARGLPIIAFDISYFRDLSEISGAVALAEWPSVKSLARRIIELDGDRQRAMKMARSAVDFATDNTQEIWLARRVGWMRRYALGEKGGAAAADQKMPAPAVAPPGI